MNKNKFDIIYESILKSLICQGGNSFQGVGPIYKDNIKPTIDYLAEIIFKPLNINKDFWTPEIGSVGKKQKSGDIDIAINFEAIKDNLKLQDITEVKTLIFQKLKNNNIQYRITSCINLKFPIITSEQNKNNEKNQQGQFVQIDLFNTSNLNYTKFNKYSPSSENSKYSGAHRSNFLRIIFKHCSIAAADQNNSDVYTSKDGKNYPSSTFKYFSSIDDGLFQTTKTFLGKDGNYLKNSKKLQTILKTVQPQEALNIIFGPNKYSIDDCDSFQTIWNNILFDEDFPYKDKRDDIILNAVNVFKDINIVIPEQIKQYLNERGLSYE